jgi:tetratricopeptide (TPR) repeat protein
MTRFIPAFLLALVPAAAFAVGSGDSSAPKPTPTSTECKEGLVYDEDKKECVAPKDSRLDDEQRYRAVRELAYAGKYRGASEVLDAMADQGSDQVLTYRGFIARKTGDIELGMAYYRQAIARNPDNLLVRSYMGQGFVEQGQIDLASDQLLEILARGGAGTWPAEALRTAIATGVTVSY